MVKFETYGNATRATQWDTTTAIFGLYLLRIPELLEFPERYCDDYVNIPLSNPILFAMHALFCLVEVLFCEST